MYVVRSAIPFPNSSKWIALKPQISLMIIIILNKKVNFWASESQCNENSKSLWRKKVIDVESSKRKLSSTTDLILKIFRDGKIRHSLTLINNSGISSFKHIGTEVFTLQKKNFFSCLDDFTL